MWALQDAKAKFSALVDAALAGTPQEVSRRGKPAVVVVSAEDWHRLRAKAKAAGLRAHLAALPDQGPDDDRTIFPRMTGAAREIDL